MEIADLKRKLKERIALGLNYGLKAVGEIINNDSLLAEELLHFKSQFNDLNRLASHNQLPYEQIEIGYNKIRLGLIDIIQKMEAADTIQHQKLPKLKNTELQFRKNNFFQLLEIHLNNLEAINVVLVSDTSMGTNKNERIGRAAFDYIYKEYFSYSLINPRRGDEELAADVAAYSNLFFAKKFISFEAYMNTVKFIIEYILEEELEQDFFLGVLFSILSRAEKALIFYYTIANIDEEFPSILLASGMFEQASAAKFLVKEEHLNLLK